MQWLCFVYSYCIGYFCWKKFCASGVENGVLFYEIISELAKIMQNDLNYSLLTLSVWGGRFPLLREQPSALAKGLTHSPWALISVVPTVFFMFWSLCRYYFFCFSQNIPGCIHISIVVVPAYRTIPCTNSKIFCVLVLIAAFTAFLRTWVESRNPYHSAAMRHCLVFKHPEKLRPWYIRNGLCQLMIFQHIPDLQVFYTDQLHFIY